MKYLGGIRVERLLKSSKLGIFKNRDFMLLLCGQLASNIANAVHSAAVAWFIMSTVGESNSGKYIAILGACNIIPYIVFGPIAGVFVDKFDRKKIIYGTDYARGSLFLILALLTYFDFYPMVSLFVITTIGALLGSLFNPAIDASVPNVVSEKDLTQANSLNGISRQLTWVIGAAISGFLYYHIGIIGVFIFDGICFILSAISEMFIRLPARKTEVEVGIKEVSKTFWIDFKGGISFIVKQKSIMIMLGFSLFLNFIFSPLFSIVLPKVVKFTLGMTAKEYGIMEAVFPIGSIIGMAIVSIMSENKNWFKIVIFSLIVQCALIILYGIPILPSVYGKLTNNTIFIIFCIIGLILTTFNALVNVPIFTAFQKLVPDEYRGRFFGVMNTATQGIVPVGLAVMGIISDKFDPSIIFIVSGILCVLMSVSMLFVPELKDIKY